MKIKVATLIVIGASLALSAAEPVRADPSGCREATDDYNDALGDVASAVRSYSNCVSGSRGKDDCSSEFNRLRSAQSEFEDAVSDIDDECDN